MGQSGDTAPRRSAAPPPLLPPRIPDDERVYAIGDVHGRIDLLEELVGLIREDSETRGPARVRVILLGDIVDRGPGSAEIVRRCMEFAAQTDRFVVLKGNHEAMMVDALRGNFAAFSLWMRSGGDAALRSWGVPEYLVEGGASPELLRAACGRIPAKVLSWLQRLPLTCRIGSYLFVHAGIRPGVALAEQADEDLLWIRREFLDSEVDHEFVVVHGHSISQDGIVIQPNRIGIDTGAYRTEILSALALEGERRWTLATGVSDGASRAS